MEPPIAFHVCSKNVFPLKRNIPETNSELTPENPWFLKMTVGPFGALNPVRMDLFMIRDYEVHRKMFSSRLLTQFEAKK